jgi:hypothetical protein
MHRDDDVDDFERRLRRNNALRVLAAGALVYVIALGLLAFSLHQARYFLEGRIELVCGFAAVIATCLMIAGGVMLARARRVEEPIPRATAR